MKAKKIIGGVSAAIAMLSLSGAAIADHDDCAAIAGEIIMKTSWLLCDDNGGKYEWDPIWQWKGKGEKGCAVHEKLAKQLFEEHGEPPKGGGKTKGRPSEDDPDHGHGAAAALLDHKYEDAILHLQNFQDTIEYSAKLNTDEGAVFPLKKNSTTERYTAAELRDWWMSWAANKQLEIYNPADETGCSVQ